MAQSEHLHFSIGGSNLNQIEERLKHLSSFVDKHPQELLRAHAESITIELLRLFSDFIDIANLDRRLSAAINIDFKTLNQAVDILEKSGLKPLKISDQLTIEPDDEIKKLRECLSDIEAKLPRLDPVGLFFRLQLEADFYFKNLLHCAASSNIRLRDIVSLTHSKLKIVPDEQLTDLWAMLTREFSAERSVPGYPTDTPHLPAKYFHFGKPDAVRKKIAQYIVNYRPLIIHDQLAKGVTRFPADLYGLGKILSWSDSPTDIRDIEESIGRSLSRIAAYREEVSLQSAGDLARLFKADPKGMLFSGSDYEIAKKNLDEHPGQAMHFLLFELQSLILCMRSLITEAEPVERTLKRYKLGLEFTLPDCRQELKDRNEKRLQRDIRKYLIDHGIYSFGTDFGHGQADAFIEDYPDSYVIEVKKFVDKKPPSEAKIRQSLVQLQNYMDAIPGPRRGIVVLFSFVEPIIVEPREWIHGRYWILPINLQGVPSKQKRSLSILESDKEELIKVLKV